MTEIVTLPPERHTAPAVNGDALDEIVYGQRVELPPMGAFENWIATLLDRCLWPHVEAHKRGRLVGEMLFTLDPHRDLKRGPDVAFVSYQRWRRSRQVPETASWDIVPEF